MADDSTSPPAWPPASLAPRPSMERRAHSPCIGICRMDDDNRYCSGCLRTIDEIAAWSTATEEVRWTVLHAVQERRARLADNDEAGSSGSSGLSGSSGSGAPGT